jgi:hypothetical protein
MLRVIAGAVATVAWSCAISVAQTPAIDSGRASIATLADEQGGPRLRALIASARMRRRRAFAICRDG